MCWNQLLLAGLSTGSIYFLTVPSDHTVGKFGLEPLISSLSPVSCAHYPYQRILNGQQAKLEKSVYFTFQHL